MQHFKYAGDKMNRIVKSSVFDYNTNKQLIEALVKEFPFLRVDISGRTLLGRGIFSFSLGSFNNSVIIAGGFEGSDGISPLLLYMFIEDICKSIKHGTTLCSVNIKRALSQLGITVIPSVNPDGREICLNGENGAKGMRKSVINTGCTDFSHWKSNSNGVDIRKNFGYNFEENRKKAIEKGITAPHESDYCGSFSESEAETKALTRLCRVRSFRQCLSVSTGYGILIPAEDNSKIPESELMAKIISQGCVYPLSLCEAEEINGFPGWFSQEFSKPAFELKAGASDSTYETCEEIYESVKEAFTVFSLM